MEPSTHSKLICIYGGIVLLMMALAVVVCVLFTSRDDPIDKTTVDRVNISVGTCEIQFKLTYRIRVTLCYQYTEPIVDIREFLGERPTIKGIQLRRDEFIGILTNAKEIIEHMNT